MFRINFDISDLYDIATIGDAATKALADGARNLAAATHAHIIEEANKKLHTRRAMFIENCSYFQADADVWIISLAAKARWIDDGMSQRDMLADLLKSPKAKTSKSGSKYIVVPFKHSGGVTENTPAQMTLIQTVKQELKKRDIPYQSIEKDASGTAKLGKLHSFDIMNSPARTSSGPGQGRGPLGKVMQGPTGIPLLKGVNIYQREVQDKQGKTSVRRDIMTFRVASSTMEGQGRWQHPGLEATHLFEDGLEWCRREWETVIGPKVLQAVVDQV